MQERIRSVILVAWISLFIVSCGTLKIHVQSGTYPPLIKSAQLGNIVEAEKLIKSGELVNQKTIGNQTALHVAAAEGQDDMVRWLLAHEADPLAQDQNGKMPADFANKQGHKQTAQIILDYIQLVKGEEQALSVGDIETLRNLLSQDLRKYTVLHIASQLGMNQLVANEIKLGARINAQTVNGFTPLHKCVLGEKIEICKMIIDAGGNVNKVDIYNNTPLHYAVHYSYKDLVNLFLNSGADLAIRSVWGNETPLDTAKRIGDPIIIGLLETK